MRSLAHWPLGALGLGGAVGAAVLALATLGAGDPAGRDLPPLERHALRDGRAELTLAPRSSSVFVFDERLWPTEP